MTHEGYRSPQLQSRSQSIPQESSEVHYPPPPGGPYSQSYNAPSSISGLERQRTHELSNAQSDGYNIPSSSRQYSSARQPINDAVTSALNTADNANAISPELISAITANVIQQLQSINMAPPPQQQAQSTSGGIVGSNSNTSSPPTEHRSVHTPPSPYRVSEQAAQTNTSPTHSQSKAMPRYAQPDIPLDQRPTSPYSQASQADDSDAREDRTARPKGPRRLSTGANPTILEKIWGTLFDEQGTATKRLGQFLRGIAVHLIEDYEPKHSLVITPDKLQKYYEDTKQPNELYPWQIVFDDRTSSISRLFREVEAQHHLVQEKLDERPDTPGLTPLGFECWVTLLLLAHPDVEFARLQKTALDMPISNPDDRKERFPKEISRRLFPTHEDQEVINKIQKAMTTNCNITINPRQAPTPATDQDSSTTEQRTTEAPQATPAFPPPSTQTTQEKVISPVTSRTQTNAIPERNGKTYSHASSEAAESSDETDDGMPTPQPIERERKPYVAQPGGGRTYEQSDLEKVVTSASSQASGQDGGVKLTRSTSMASNGRPPDLSKSRPISITVHQRGGPSAMDNGPMSADSGTTRHRRANSIYNREHHPRARSPSASHSHKDYGHKSEEFGTSSYHSSNSNDLRDRDRERDRDRDNHADRDRDRDRDRDKDRDRDSHRDEDGAARGYHKYERERERRANDRFDPARMAAYDPRDREREPRQRFQSTVGLEGGRGHYLSDEEYYRAMGNVMGDRGVSATGSSSIAGAGTGVGGRDGYPRDRERDRDRDRDREAYPPNSYR